MSIGSHANTFRKRGGSWVHDRDVERDTEATFVHSVCGISFSPHQVVPADIGNTTASYCPSCQEITYARARDALTLHEPPHTFRPRTAEIAQAWTGPDVEVAILMRAGVPEVAVFLDGTEVPVVKVAAHMVDPFAGHMRSAWQAETQRLATDPALSPEFRDRLVSERDDVLERDGGQYIVDDETPGVLS